MKTEVKTSVEGLQIGMYVCRLDRPWIKTPFALQGLLIRSEADIEDLRKYCNYVYVDVEKGSSPDPRFWILSEGPRSYTQTEEKMVNPRVEQKPVVLDELRGYRRRRYQDTVRFDDEVKQAEAVYDRVEGDLHNMLQGLQQGKHIDLAAVRQGVSDMTDSIIRNPAAMMWIINLRRLDDYSYIHSLGTSVWCATFGRHLGLDKGALDTLALGGLLLDVGKSKIRRELLQKKGELSAEEISEIRGHVNLGVKMLVKNQNAEGGAKIPMDALQMVATHHERADGSGYPQGLVDGEIPLFGRIAGIVDSFDAMSSRRPYADHEARSPHEAISELYELRGKQFQAELIEQFIQAVGLYPTGTLVELSTGEVGAVVAVNGLRRLRPSVMLLLDENKQPLSQFRHVDLSQASGDVQVVRGLSSGAYGIDMKELFL